MGSFERLGKKKKAKPAWIGTKRERTEPNCGILYLVWIEMEMNMSTKGWVRYTIRWGTRLPNAVCCVDELQGR